MVNFHSHPMWHSVTGLANGVYAGQTVAISDPQQPIQQPYLQHNLALHVGDDVQAVQQQRLYLLQQLHAFGVTRLHWLQQTHSTTVHQLDERLNLDLLDGDAWITRQQGVGLAIMTADCLAIVLCDENGTEVACLHAGWRGLLNGIIEKTVQAMQTPAHYAWISVAICQQNFEVGAEVRQAFVESQADFADAFIPNSNGEKDKYLADLYAIARQKLTQLGVTHIHQASQCSFADSHYYSYRRQATTGRMATFVFLNANQTASS